MQCAPHNAQSDPHIDFSVAWLTAARNHSNDAWLQADPSDNEDLHVLVTADTDDQLEKVGGALATQHTVCGCLVLLKCEGGGCSWRTAM